MEDILIRPSADQDKPWLRALLRLHWCSEIIVTCGKIWDVSQLPGFVAILSDRQAGLITC